MQDAGVTFTELRDHFLNIAEREVNQAMLELHLREAYESSEKLYANREMTKFSSQKLTNEYYTFKGLLET